LDNKTGIYHQRNRYYKSGSGRFVSRDILGYIDGMTLYAYVRNNSINWLDPYGLNGGDGKEVGETEFEWLRKLWGTSYRPGLGLRTPQMPTPLTGIGNTLLSPEGAEAQRGGIEWVRRAQRDKQIAGESVYGTYSPLTESGNPSPQKPPSQAPTPQKPVVPPVPTTPQRPEDLLSPRTRELMEVESQLYKVDEAFEAVGKQWDDLRCVPGYKHEYEASKHRIMAQYFLLRRLKGELRKRRNELKKGF
jgi:hypothetical protein